VLVDFCAAGRFSTMSKFTLIFGIFRSLLIVTSVVGVHQTVASPNPNDTRYKEAFAQEPASVIEDNKPSSRVISQSHTQSLLVVLVNFQDIKIQTPAAEIYQRVFGSDRSVASYFKRNTYGKFDLMPPKAILGQVILGLFLLK
jgi:hypothetical protein